MNKVLSLILVLFLFSHCVPESKRIMTEVALDPTRPEQQRIIDHMIRQERDSLLGYLSHPDPSFRYLAAKSFSSFQDERALDSLYGLLDDPAVKVRAMAAYAIGQIRSSSSEEALISGFRQKDTMTVDNIGNANILLGLGKLAGAPIAKYISSADGYRDIDTLLLEGQMQALYQFGIRGMQSEEMIERSLGVIKDKSLTNKARLYAANFLARSKDLNTDKVKFQIAEAFVVEENDHIKMALASALRHAPDPEILDIILSQLDLQLDYRVTCSLLRSLSVFDYEKSLPKVLELLRSKNTHVARSAIDFIRKVGKPEDASLYRNIARDSIDFRVKGELYEAIFSILPYYYAKTKNATRWQVQQLLSSAEDPYEMRAYISALGNDPESYPQLMEFAKESEDPIIRTAAIESLGKVVAHKDFNAVFQGYSKSIRSRIKDYIAEVLNESNDEGMLAAAADIIANEDSGMDELIDSTEFLIEAKERLRIPGQLESIHAIEKALARLRGVTNPIMTKAGALKKIDWVAYNKIDEKTRAIVKTNRGNFTINFYKKEAPISVINFIELSKKQFYDSCAFHRVVPNFVIQTGSPRGDNYGGADHVISSELGPLNYDDEGYVGMASAGRHTESTQWFVTHSPSPHLDGRYTIFGKISDGMDVVHNIQVGDFIIDIIITDL